MAKVNLQLNMGKVLNDKGFEQKSVDIDDILEVLPTPNMDYDGKYCRVRLKHYGLIRCLGSVTEIRKLLNK